MSNNLNLLITFYSDHYQNSNQNCNSDSLSVNDLKNITWSPYDRVVFKAVKSLQELCNSNHFLNISNELEEDCEEIINITNKIEENKKPWIGVKQCMHLIEEVFNDEKQSCSKWSLNINKNDNGFIFNVKQASHASGIEELEEKYDFYCIYSMRFSNVIHNLRTREQIWDKKIIRENIFKKVFNVVNGRHMDFKCFRSLGSEDMVIIFLAKSMKDITFVGEYISNLTIKFPAQINTNIFNNKSGEDIRLFSTICVFSGFNSDQAYNKNIDTDLVIHLNLRHDNNINQIIQKIQGELNTNCYDQVTKIKDMKSKLQCSLEISYEEFSKELDKFVSQNTTLQYHHIFWGIGALIIHIPADTAKYNIFSKDGIFNESSDFYKSNIYSTKTYFCITKPENEAENGLKDKDTFLIDISELPIELSCIYPLILNNNGNIKNKIYYEENNNEVANFIFEEYDRLINNQRAVQWHSQLSRQRDIIKSFTNYYIKCNLKFYVCDLLNYAQSSLHLINQACSPASEIPNHNHFYSGSFHDIIKAYYGIIDVIFNIGRNLPHDSDTHQHVVDYAICLNSTARIESKIFTRSDIKSRFVVFFLPYDDFWNFSENIKLLVHEVFHYIAPYSRKIRAEYFVKTMFTMLIRERITYLCTDKLKQDNCLSSVNDGISEWIYWMVENYDTDVKKNILKDLNEKFPGFFIHSNPEWRDLYFGNLSNILLKDHSRNGILRYRGSIDNILLVVDNYVKEYIINSCEKAFEEIYENTSPESMYIRKTFTVDFIREKLYKQDNYNHSYNCFEKAIDNVRVSLIQYDTATKEAFCDMWSVLLTGLTIPKYITVVFEKMKDIYGEDEVLKALSIRNYRSAKTDIRATVIRILLLIHKLLESNLCDSNMGYEKALKSIFNNVINNGQNDYIEKCINELSSRYDEFINVIKNEIDSLSKIAFYGMDKRFNFISKKNPRNCCEIIKKAANIDLTSNIGMETIDMLSDFIGEINEEISEFTNDDTVLYNFAKYNRIGENSQYKMFIRNTNDMLEAINEIRKGTAPNPHQPHTLWYRGVCSDKFSLLPSLFRKGNPDVSLYVNQANIIKRAYFSTLYASDIWNLPIEQRMAYLQHYGMPTNLLDFSIDPFVALHFALNPDVLSDREKVNSGIFQPVIYAFDPIIYGQAIRKMIEHNPMLNVPDSISAVEFDINHDKGDRSPFFVDDMSYEFLSEHNNKHMKEYTPNDRGDPFPVPIVIQQSNMRIAAQSGTFVAFSLDALPQRNNNGNKFAYLNLMTVQQRYTNFLSKTTNFDQQFIFPIYLRKSSVALFKEELKSLNINTGKFYPELSKIFEDTISNGMNDGI